MRASRFQQEYSGILGEFWKAHAEKELEELRQDLANGDITIDENGVARNKIGRAVMSDLLEKLLIVTDDIDEEATKAAREAELAAFTAEYKKNYTGPSEEEIAEMRAAFGPGQTIVNIITGTIITL